MLAYLVFIGGSRASGGSIGRWLMYTPLVAHHPDPEFEVRGHDTVITVTGVTVFANASDMLTTKTCGPPNG
jgi:hypothetical protein